ncbi:hypothetical protein PV08_04757 [Exophiala spinifera]|uniref:SET domain-containing protein n=1 Tax=Exophiala spinifera TaxID=91928 RepID=A0A0D2BF26_9EURO|nr:uncharacterized protein PV08_04757 [Exophiala spinifera]KIW17563.1 hypothetical protein PV08_04757 [Exophiala spinifera]
MATPATHRTPTGEENNTSRQPPSRFPTLSASSPRQGPNASNFDGNPDDPIVLSDSDDEDSDHQPGWVDLTSDNERDRSLNPWRRVNHKPQQSTSSPSQLRSAFSTRQSPQIRDSGQAILPRPVIINQSSAGAPRIVPRPTDSTGGQTNLVGRRKALDFSARKPQVQPRGGYEVRTGMAEAPVSGRTSLQTFSAASIYSDPAHQRSPEEPGRVPFRPTATNSQSIVRPILANSINQTLQDRHKRIAPNLFSQNVYRSSRSSLPDTINDNSIRTNNSTEPPAEDPRSGRSDHSPLLREYSTTQSRGPVSSAVGASAHNGQHAHGPQPSISAESSSLPLYRLRPVNPVHEVIGRPSNGTMRASPADQENRAPGLRFERPVESATQSILRRTRPEHEERAIGGARTNVLSGEAIERGRKPDQREFLPVHHIPEKQAIDQNAQTDGATAEMIEDDSFASDDSNTTPSVARIEPRLETMKAIIENLRKDQQACRERSVQAELRQASVDMRKRSGPVVDAKAADPFAVLTEKRRSEYAAESASLIKPQSKKLQLIPACETSFWTGGTILPKYKAIGRVSSSFLSPGFRTAKYHPYDAEDEIQDPDKTRKYEERYQRLNNNFESLVAQRHCQELVWLWKPWAEDLLSVLKIQDTDVLYFFMMAHFDPERHIEVGDIPKLREEQSNKCRSCGLGPDSRRTHFEETFSSLPKPDDETLALAGIAAYAFHEATDVSLWHIALGGLIQPRYEDPSAKRNKDLELCVICFRHQCPDHGSYEEPAEDVSGAKDPDEDIAAFISDTAFINDEERDHNIRKFISLPMRNKTGCESHTCGIFCVDPSRTLRQILGRQADGTVDGDFRPVTQRRHILEDGELCGSSCFWDTTQRRNIKITEVKFQPFQSHSQKVVVDKALQFYLNNKRGPCLIAQIVKDVSCMRIFEYFIWRIASKAHPSVDGEITSDSSTAQRINHARKKKKPPPPNIDTSWSAELDDRKAFVPCSHEGPCYNNPACSCSKSKVHCERMCGCDESCKRRFRGCTCTMRGNKNCFKDSRCDCWSHNRECDPFLCGKCGVLEVLDSNNKYNEEIRKGRCRNNRIQLGLLAPTTKAPSQVQGYGLYSKAAIPAGEFIGEYTGEIINIREGDRRGAMYSVLKQEYLFKINVTQEIDASNYGNKMRFMNNSQLDEYINVEPKKLWCSGVVRLGLFARRFIEPGEELLYNYNYPESVSKHFWEPGEKPANARRAIPMASERIARTTEANAITAEQSNHPIREESSQSPLLSRHAKRKRPPEDSPSVSSHRNLTQSSGEGSSTEETLEVPEISETDDSEYSETSGQVSEGGEEADELSGDESELDPIQLLPTRRRGSRPSLLTGRATSRASSLRHSTDGGSTRSRSQQGSKPSATSSGRRGAAGGSVQMVKRRRKIGPNDRRLGGRSQQLAWQTRRARENQERGNTAATNDV